MQDADVQSLVDYAFPPRYVSLRLKQFHKVQEGQDTRSAGYAGT